MKTISILDTDITSSNLGNEIIMESIYDFLNKVFFDEFIIKIQCTDHIGPMSKKYIGLSDFSFIGGSNLLTSKMNRYKQIGFSIKDTLNINEMILFGVGWWQYQANPNFYSRFFIRNLLSRKMIHSVRDEYTKKRLNSIGFENVLNTSCPSTWSLTKDHCKEIPSYQSANVVFTITDYNYDKQNDLQFINFLKENYQTVYFWPQGLNDLAYFNELDINLKNKIIIIPPKLKAFDNILNQDNIEYIGTRLHAGIRALQKKKRALILAIDNRASEIAKDIGINIASRKSLSDLRSFADSKFSASIKIPEVNINFWKDQF